MVLNSVSKYEFYIGIDPGKTDGYTSIITDGGIIATILSHKNLNIHEYLTQLKHYAKRSFALIEKVNSSPQQGVVSAFTFGREVGYREMALAALKIQSDTVTPSKWQGALRALTKGQKEVTKLKAMSTFPQYTALINVGNADSLLIAEYCRRFCNNLLNT